MNVPLYIVGFSGVAFHFDSEQKVRSWVEMLFSACPDRKELYKTVIFSTVHLTKSAEGESRNQYAKSCIRGAKVILDLFGEIYDPSHEILTINDPLGDLEI